MYKNEMPLSIYFTTKEKLGNGKPLKDFNICVSSDGKKSYGVKQEKKKTGLLTKSRSTLKLQLLSAVLKSN